MEQAEIYFELVSNLGFLGIMLVTAYCYYYLAKQFMENRTKVCLVGVVYFSVMVCLYYIPQPMKNFTAYALGVLAGFLVMCLLERKNIEQKIFLTVTFFSLRWLSMAMENCIERVVYQGVQRVIGMEYNWKIQLFVFTLQYLMNILLSFGFMFFSVWMIQKAYVYKQEKTTKKELVMLLVPSLCGMLGYEVMQYYQNVYERDTRKSIYEIYSGYNGLCFLYYIFSFGAILVVTVIFQNIKSMQKEENQKELLAEQIENTKRHIGEVEKLYQDIRSLKHDMGNHIVTLEQLYKKSEYEEAEKYLVHLKEEFQETVQDIRSGNPVTDVILMEQQKTAEEYGIQFLCEFQYPQNTNINAFDLSVILNNALNNAIEHNRGMDERYIRIVSYRKKNAYIIEIENSFSGEVVYCKDSGLPKTTKWQEKEHGFGLTNIRRVSQKYHGDIEIEQREGTFKLSILLMIEE